MLLLKTETTQGLSSEKQGNNARVASDLRKHRIHTYSLQAHMGKLSSILQFFFQMQALKT